MIRDIGIRMWEIPNRQLDKKTQGLHAGCAINNVLLILNAERMNFEFHSASEQVLDG